MDESGLKGFEVGIGIWAPHGTPKPPSTSSRRCRALKHPATARGHE
jgi:hypothetical protein